MTSLPRKCRGKFYVLPPPQTSLVGKYWVCCCWFISVMINHNSIIRLTYYQNRKRKTFRLRNSICIIFLLLFLRIQIKMDDQALQLTT
uniref:Putative ovule protein n=1 Tax=Solanum chacoense TaxID=4108 RepID=A0A0V0GUR4_SOLCH